MKVAILGGGMGSLAAAWELAHAPGASYDITVYQRDHVLGGKGAAVRSKLVTGEEWIEEHGIHILFGFYSELMSMLKQAYSEAPKTSPSGTLPDFADALSPNDWAFLADQYPEGNWRTPWGVEFPTLPGHPWDGQGADDLQELFDRLLQRILEFAQLLSGTAPWPAGIPLSVIVSKSVATIFTSSLFDKPSIAEGLSSLIHDVLKVGWSVAKLFLADDNVRRIWIGLYLAGTNLAGLLESGILFSRDYDSINDRDYRDWLAEVDPFAPGDVPPIVSWDSPPVRALYDVVFSRSTTFAAGVMLRDAIELALGYRGHLSYRMNGSMGEVVFAPLFLALRKKGVKFEYYHEVTGIHVQADGADKVVEQVEFGRRLLKKSFEPLVPAAGSGVPTWPKEVTESLPSPDAFAINRGVDFDVVVLGIGIGAFDADDSTNLAYELCANNPKFKAMVESVGTMKTQAAQLWLDESVADLGWPLGPPGGPMLISYARPFNSWSDMTHVVASENWPDKQNAGPHSLAYFADELHDGEGSTAGDVKNNMRQWLKTNVTRVWPNFTFGNLHDPQGRLGEERLDFQYFRVNTEGSELYTLSEKDTIAQRLRPHESGFRNLALAGDWVYNRLNAGAVEAATLAGKGAGRAIVDGDVSA